ncbi:MAG: response regulator transcription factor [Acetatifactor sp.]
MASLTEQGYEIVGLMVERLSNREIAERLFLSEGSIKQYINQIYSKLHIEGDTRIKRKRLSELFSQKTNLWLIVIRKNPPYNDCTVDFLCHREGGFIWGEGIF